MKRITIAIDGYSSTGKSTVAKALAKRLSYTYVDSGAMYRAVTYFAMINNCFEDGLFNSNKLKNTLDQIHISFKYNNDIGYSEVYLNDKNIESEIRSLEVSNFVSHVAEVSEVRKLMVKQQQAMGRNKGVVMDGRDIGTVVFKDAELKLFMTASSEVRAKRRFEELISKGDNVKYEEVLENIINRDHIDTTRADSPLTKAIDAIEIDNSSLSKLEQLDVILKYVERIITE
jgi:cytidylate kinase